MNNNHIKRLFLGAVLFNSVFYTAQAAQVDVDTALKAGKLAVAIESYQALSTTETSDVFGQLLWARILLAQDKTEHAYNLLESLVEKESENADIQFYFGQSAMVMAQKASIFSKMGYAKDGRKAWKKALALNPEHQATIQGLIGFHRFAPGIAGGDIEKALDYAKRLQKLDGPVGTASLVGVYQSMDKEELALKTLNQGIKDFPTNSRLLFIRAMKYVSDEDWKLAHQDLVDALTLAKSDMEKSDVLYQLGKVAVKSGEYTKQAIKYLHQLMTIKGHQYSEWGNLRLAQLYVADGDLLQAKSTLKRINDNDDDELEDELKRLKKQLKKMSN